MKEMKAMHICMHLAFTKHGLKETHNTPEQEDENASAGDAEWWPPT